MATFGGQTGVPILYDGNSTLNPLGGLSTGIGHPTSGATGGRAYGTLTPAAVAANDTFAVNGVTFTVKAAVAALTDVIVCAAIGSETQTSVNVRQGKAIADAINAYGTLNSTFPCFATAHPSTGLVTVTSDQFGTGGNSVALAGTAVRLVASGATLSGGVSTAGVGTATDFTVADGTALAAEPEVGNYSAPFAVKKQ